MVTAVGGSFTHGFFTRRGPDLAALVTGIPLKTTNSRFGTRRVYLTIAIGYDINENMFYDFFKGGMRSERTHSG